jgi:hypothetical protein
MNSFPHFLTPIKDGNAENIQFISLASSPRGPMLSAAFALWLAGKLHRFSAYVRQLAEGPHSGNVALSFGGAIFAGVHFLYC